MACDLRFAFLAAVQMLFLAARPVLGQQSPSPSTAPPTAAAVEPGEVVSSTYHNGSLGFRYPIPVGWVDRTAEVREAATNHEKASVLLAIFERPPEAAGETVNSAVVIAVEAASAYPGLKTAAQYFGPVTELTTSKGFTPVAEPYEFPVDGRPIVRGDFQRAMGSITMHQSTLAMLTKGSILSFTFLAGSYDEVTAMVEQLAFGRPKKPTHK
jgi:hypothetical protein